MATEKPCIVVIGSCNIDLVFVVDRTPEAGETLTSTGFHVGHGGKGNNQAVACAKLSRKRRQVSEAMVNVKMIGTVGGQDAFGQQLKDSMVSCGIDDSGVHLAAESTTGMASIYVEKATGQNRIVINAGANALTTSQRVLQALRDIAMPIDLIVMQLEVPMSTVVDVLRFSKKEGIATLLNAAPAATLDESIYPCITHLVVNESEAALLSGREAAELDDEDVVVRTASELQSKGVEIVIITLGAKGAVLKGRGTPAQHLPAKKVKALDTTAAGDTFIGAYALGVALAKQSLPEIVQTAMDAAAITVQRHGAVDSIPWLDEFQVQGTVST